ncbi:TOMM precursor leader peptide-binding protein [Sorangium sp. So ce887]|uniref:TOMM precursor leader peptide-binding protein n=1 Tax=Sorangium sp. So ce887 TaxID=3133324 RepID=UPI003F63DBA4
MPVKPGGVEPWMGPMFRPGAGPCWACLAHRVRHNRPVEAYLERRRGGGDPLLAPRVVLPAGRSAALGLAAVLLARWIAAGGAGPLDDRLYSLDLACMRLAEHPNSRLRGFCDHDPRRLRGVALQCFIEIEPDEPLLAQALPWLGEDDAIFGTDFPHIDHDAGLVERALALRGRLPGDALRKILWDKAARFYGIEE